MDCSSKQYNYRETAERLFEGSLRTVLEEFDRKRHNYMAIGLAIIAVSSIVIFFSGTNDIIRLAAIGGIVIGVVVAFAGGRRRRNFYRREVVPQLVKGLSPDLKYFPDKGLPQSKFRRFELFRNFDRYSSEDYLSGMIGKTGITAAEVHIEERRRSKDGDSYITVFRGIIFIADFNKNFNSRTVVVPDVAERFFGKLAGNFLQQLNWTENGKLVKLENPEFEKKFAVYSTDPMEARYILTPKLMERLLAVQAAECSPIRALFSTSNMILAFSRSSGWLEPPEWGKLADVAVIEKTLTEIGDLLELVDDLDLNTRIWSKQ